MNSARQVWLGILSALLSSAVVLGSLALALVESGSAVALISTPTETFVAPPELVITSTFETATGLTPVPTLTPLPSITPTPICPPPPGWVQVASEVDDSWDSLAQRYGLSSIELLHFNCLSKINTLPPQTLINVPAIVPSPTATLTAIPTSTPVPSKTSIACGRPPGWVTYRVRPGDTLFLLAQRLGITVQQLQTANCISNPSRINSGSLIYVPFIPAPPPPTRTPLPVATATPIPTTLPTATTPPTNTPQPPAATRTPTATPPPGSATSTSPAASPTPTLRPTQMPTDTPRPITPTPTATTQAPTATPAPPTSTTAPPTATQPPPTATLAPPTATLAPPTPTLAPPTNTLIPVPTKTRPLPASPTPGQS
jgi:LysM repeat protein